MPTADSLSQDQIREFVIAGHGNLPKVKEMLAANPELLNVSYQWSENDWETAVQAAAHVGSTAVAEFLLGQGAPLAICTAAMLGRSGDVERMLAEDPALIRATGAHGIPLLTHAALSGSVKLVEMLFRRGAQEGTSYALHNAVVKNHVEAVRWLLANGKPDLGWKNFEGKTVLTVATERRFDDIIALLKAQNATV